MTRDGPSRYFSDRQCEKFGQTFLSVVILIEICTAHRHDVRVSTPNFIDIQRDSRESRLRGNKRALITV